MDLRGYIKRSNALRSQENKKRECMHCGRFLENEGDYLFYQRFCNEKCKQRYLDSVRESNPNPF